MGRSVEIGINIKRWAAWAPGIESKSDWNRWASGDSAFTGEGVPLLEYVPAMQRRRMSLLTKMALQAAHDCLGGLDISVPTVFSSRHGEIIRTMDLLQSVAEKEPLSPAAFSMSVHNTSAGLQSILTKNILPSTTLSAGKDSLCQAVIEAYSRSIQSGGEDVLLIYSDTRLPKMFVAHSDEEMVDHALALLVCADKEEADYYLSWVEPTDDVDPDTLPHSLAFVRFLCQSTQAHLVFNSKQRQWCWSRKHATN